MRKRIIVIGGGVSGLCVLHQLKKRYLGRDDIEITLLEKNDYAGGTIRTHRDGETIFECGPNGFLASQPSTLELVEEMGLTPELEASEKEAKTRYVEIEGKLHAIPMGPGSLLRFEPMTLGEKLRMLLEIGISRTREKRETVFEFGRRRFGEKFAEFFMDPMVSGVFGGDAKEICLDEAFPRIREIERRFHSLFIGMIGLGLSRGRKRDEERFTAAPRGVLTSFRLGMDQLTDALLQKYRRAVVLSRPVEGIARDGKAYLVKCGSQDIRAQCVYLCVPAYAAAGIVRPLNPALANRLEEVEYAPLAVIGLRYRKGNLNDWPPGFGYLVPSAEHKEILGVLFSSNIFSHRAGKDCHLMRVMIGGARHPQIRAQRREQLIAKGIDEVRNRFRPRSGPESVYVSYFERGIPQYTMRYAEIKPIIREEEKGLENIHLAANYLDGIALNDCTRNAVRAAAACEL